MTPFGQIIMMGGQSPVDPGSFRNAVPWTKEWNPVAGTWQLLADMQHGVGRWYPGLARLADGSFLVMGGGQCCNAARTSTCERFDLSARAATVTACTNNGAALRYGMVSLPIPPIRILPEGSTNCSERSM